MPNLRRLAVRPPSQALQLAHDHPDLVVLWGTSVALLSWGTAANNDHASRWSILLGLMCLLLSTIRLARWVVARLTQIVALWEEDVPLPAEPGADVHVLPHHRAAPAGDSPRKQRKTS